MCELDAGQPVRCAAARVAPLLVIVVGATVLPITATQASPAPGSQALRSSVPPSSAVAIPTGADAQALVAHNPAGTAFIIETGIHADFSVIPKSQDTFYADPGAILDGLGILPSAFREVRSSPALGVAVIGASATSPLVIRHYGSASAAQVGAIQPLPGNRVPINSAWWLQWLDVEQNAARGISLTTGMEIRGSSVIGNGRLGIGGGGTHIVI